MFFKSPHFFLLFILLVPFAYYVKRKSKSPSLRFSNTLLLDEFKPSLKARLSSNLIWLRFASLCLVIFALARPQLPVPESKLRSEGIDIVLAIDCSTSMRALDFKINGKRADRLEVVKTVVADFIKARQSDRIGLVAFSARPYTVCPLTLDYDWLISNLERVKTGMIEDGTAIGSGIAASLARLRQSRAKSKIIILLTDGVNNTGKTPPLTAADAARALNVKVYTIGSGSRDVVPYPVQGLFGNIVYQNVKIELDEDTLMKIAEATNGKYYRATDTQSLKKIYKEIDSLEKTPVEEKGYLEYKELFAYFAVAVFIFLAAEIVLSQTILRKLP